MSFDDLREQYPVFTYDSHQYELTSDGLRLQFHFRIGDDIVFHPEMTLCPGRHAQWPSDLRTLDGIIFHIGMIELVSYWKCTCSPTILIKPYRLSDEQQFFWRKLYWNGLGEFVFKNHIHSDAYEFFDFGFPQGAPDAATLPYPCAAAGDRVIVPIGGGKDSVVTLEELRARREVVPFIINPRGATLDCVRVAGFDNPDDIIILRRQIDPKLIELNAQGFLNGHTPFSAMLAFYTVLLSAVTGIRDVALSNESSANEPTIPGTHINHQYSKSLEFEQDFSQYVINFMGNANHYYSHLRPLTELQIAERFAQYPQYFPVFKSCNAGSKENRWCCNCPKCLFAYIILAPFVSREDLKRIFGEELLDKPELVRTFDELTGLSPIKPFECVGTLREVNEAIHRILESHKDQYLIKHYINAQISQIENDLMEGYINMAP